MFRWIWFSCSSVFFSSPSGMVWPWYSIFFIRIKLFCSNLLLVLFNEAKAMKLMSRYISLWIWRPVSLLQFFLCDCHKKSFPTWFDSSEYAILTHITSVLSLFTNNMCVYFAIRKINNSLMYTGILLLSVAVYFKILFGQRIGGREDSTHHSHSRSILQVFSRCNNRTL